MRAIVCDKCGKVIKGSYINLSADYVTNADTGNADLCDWVTNVFNELINELKVSRVHRTWNICPDCLREIMKGLRAKPQPYILDDIETEEESDEE